MNNYANSRWKERGSFSKDILHSYQDIIDAIRTAPYGFDTREAMAQMLMFLYGTVQSIGDNFSIDMSPTDTFENLGKLKEKYPNGQQGVFVVQDTGHWYFWSELENTWKDGGIYQSAGINFSNTPANKIGGYVLPLSIGSIGIAYGSNQTITIDLPSKILYTKVEQNGKISLEGCATTQSTIDFTNGEYLIFDIPNLVFKNVTQGELNALTNEYIILGYNSYGIFKGPWSNYINSFKDLNYSKNLLIFPSKDLQISVDASNNATVNFISKNLFYQKLDSNELGTYTVADSKIVVPNNQYLVFDLNQKVLKVLTESQFVSDVNSSILCFYNYHGTIFGQWSNYVNSFKDLNYSKNLLIFPSKDLQISVDASNNATVYFNSKNLFYQKLDSNELGTYTVADSKIVVPNSQYLVFDLNQKVLKVLTESQFVSDMNSSILCFYNYYGNILGQWSIYYKSVDDELPGYYHADNYIDSKVDKINSNSSIASGVNFAYITDTHYGDNAGQSGNLLKYIKENTAISTVVFGGDIVRAYGTKANAWDDVKKYTNLVDDIGIIYGTKGNHDITIKASANETTGWTAPQSTIYDILNRKNERLIDNGINNKSYYYFDNKIQKVRFIVLDQYEDVQSGETTYWGTNSKFNQEQLDWLINDALNIDGYTLVVFTHSPSDSSMQYYSPYLDVVQKLLVAVANKQHFTYNQNELTADVDFSKTTNTIACHLSGHAHIDETHVDNSVLSIGVLCDAAYNDDPQYKDKPRTKGTINEQAFDIVSLDTTNRTIKLVRIGQGNDREFNY